ncbi:MAG: ABC transporter substrate-binding protein [Sphingomonadaceae bacterium]|nr:ABC transporter substrate-binding protein [Sphingomonadaceae bacterium]
MFRPTKALLAASLAIAGMAAPAALAPASAAVSQANPSAFVESLAGDTLVALRTGTQAQRRARFSQMLGEHFAVRAIGDRLITRWRSRITPTQYQSYQRALPGFLLGTYADRLSSYANARVEVVNATERSGDFFVATRVTNPGDSPVRVIWQLSREGARYRVVNMNVAGINLTLNQAQDFDSYIQRNGFDRLVAFMQSRG